MLDPSATQVGRTLAGMCGAASAATSAPVTPPALANAYASAATHGRPLYVIATQPSEIPAADKGVAAPTTSYPFAAWQEEIVKAPSRAKHWRPAYWVAKVNADGRAETVSSTPG